MVDCVPRAQPLLAMEARRAERPSVVPVCTSQFSLGGEFGHWVLFCQGLGCMDLRCGAPSPVVSVLLSRGRVGVPHLGLQLTELLRLPRPGLIP